MKTQLFFAGVLTFIITLYGLNIYKKQYIKWKRQIVLKKIMLQVELYYVDSTGPFSPIKSPSLKFASPEQK